MTMCYYIYIEADHDQTCGDNGDSIYPGMTSLLSVVQGDVKKDKLENSLKPQDMR